MAVLKLSTDPGREPDRIDVQHLALEPDEGVILRFPRLRAGQVTEEKLRRSARTASADPAGEAARQ